MDSARKARDGIVENMLSLQDMDVSASEKESETFHAEMNIMFDELLDATDEVESLQKEMGRIGQNIIDLYQHDTGFAMDPLAKNWWTL